MTKLMMIGLLIGGSSLPAAAADAPKSYEAGAALRYVDLDTRGNRGRVQQYDGKLYKYMHGDIWVSNQGEKGLFDISLRDIGSTEENGSLHADYKDSLRVKAEFSSMHHRQNFERTGAIINGAWTPSSHFNATNDLGRQPVELLFRRTQATLNIDVFGSANPARFFSAEYNLIEKAGSAAMRGAGPRLARGDVDNTRHDITLGAGTDVTENAAVALEVVRSEFKDNANNYKSNITTQYRQVIRPNSPTQSMTGAALRFRHNVSKELAVTGAFTGNSWDNLSNQYSRKAVVGSLNAAYKHSKKLSLTGKLYLRAWQIDENRGYIGRANNNNYPGQGNQMDKTTLRADLLGVYKPMDRVSLKGGYRMEVENRRDAPAFTEPAATVYYFNDAGGVDAFLPGSQTSRVAHNVVKHTLSANAQARLPLGIEAEASYKRLQATQSAFANSPRRQDDANLTITAPLPGDVELSVSGGYLTEAGNSDAYLFNTHQNTYRAALDWDMTDKVSFGADGSYESIRTANRDFIGEGAATPATVVAANKFYQYVADVMRHQKNTTAGAHGRFVLPKGFLVKGDGSYTWSTFHAPMQWKLVGTVAGLPTDAVVGEYVPRDIRIARGSATVEYSPAKYKNLTARASYRIDDWIDKVDSDNNGRASVAELGVSAKF